jgi:phenylalanine-4-hydroxylase
MDFEGSLGDPAVQRLMEDLGPLTQKLMVLDEKDVHWFPRHISDLDLIAHRTLDAGTDLESDHPGFNDAIYRERRATLTTNALNHRWDQPIPKIDYTLDETAVWTAVWDRMDGLWKKYACKEYLVREESKQFRQVLSSARRRKIMSDKFRNSPQFVFEALSQAAGRQLWVQP